MNLNFYAPQQTPVIIAYIYFVVVFFSTYILSNRVKKNNEIIAQISHCNLSHAEQCATFIVSLKRTWLQPMFSEVFLRTECISCLLQTQKSSSLPLLLLL